MGHICKKCALGNICLLCLLTHPLYLFYIFPCLCHVQNQDNISFVPPNPIWNLLHMPLIKRIIQTEFFLHIHPQNIFRNSAQFLNILTYNMTAQFRKNLCSGRIETDNPLLLIQGDYTIPHTVKQNTCSQSAEIINLPAPYQDYYYRQDDSQCKRSRIIYVSQFHTIGAKRHNRQKGKRKNQPVLTLRSILRIFYTGLNQRIYGQGVWHDRAENKKYPVSQSVIQVQITMPILRYQPIYLTIVKVVGVTGKYKTYNKYINQPYKIKNFYRLFFVTIVKHKITITDWNCQRAHILHLDGNNGRLQPRRCQLQQISGILYQRPNQKILHQFLFA